MPVVPITTNKGTRVHITTPQEWSYACGTDFWFMPCANGMLTAGNAHELSDYGWTTTSMVIQDGVGADFMSSSDNVPGLILTNAASDLIKSPAIFGDYTHAWMAGQFLGYFPTRLNAEFWAAFTTASNNETTTAIGFVEDGGSVIVANDAMATIVSNGTNFLLRSGAASATLAAIDTSLHKWRIVVDSAASITAYIDDVAQANTLAIQADEWPAAFGFGQGTSNVIAMSIAHIWYD